MRKTTRPVAGLFKATAAGTKFQTGERVKPEGATMGTAGKNTAKTSATAPLSKVQMQKAHTNNRASTFATY